MKKIILNKKQKDIIAVASLSFFMFGGLIIDFFAETGLWTLCGMTLGFLTMAIYIAVPEWRKEKAKISRAKRIRNLMVKKGLWQPAKMSQETKRFLILVSVAIVALISSVVSFETKHPDAGSILLFVSGAIWVFIAFLVQCDSKSKKTML